MTTTLESPRRLHALLGDDGQDLRQRTAAALLPALQVPLAALGVLSGGARGRVARQAAQALDELLDVDLCDLVGTAWTRCAAVLDAARRTAADGSREDVQLHAHAVEVEHRPAVDVLVDGRPVGAVEARLDLVLRAARAAAVVEAGCLVSVEVGACEVELTVTVAGVEVARHEGALPCALDVPLGEGVVLVPSRTPVPAQQDVSTTQEDVAAAPQDVGSTGQVRGAPMAQA